jgi:uncharacterized protein
MGGMVRYTQPVYKNGKRVLWHGAWRGSSYSRRGAAPARAPVVAVPVAAAAAAATAVAPTATTSPSQPLKPYGIAADPDDLTAARMARDFVAVLSDKGGSGRAVVVPTSPNGLSRATKTGVADFAILSLDTALLSAKADPNWISRVPLVTALAPETIEVIAPPEVKSIADLEGKQISAGDPDTATANSTRLLFQRLGVNVTPVYEPLTEGLQALAAGKRGAIVVIGAKDSHALDDFGADQKFHLVPIPWTAALEQVYTPTRVVSSERPNLIAANDTVETISEPMALVAIEAAANSPRAEALGRVAQVFLTNYDGFLADGRDSHWRDVNLAADASLLSTSWPRLAAVQTWLDGRKLSTDASLDAFRASAKTAAADGGPKAEDSDRLYESLTRWRSLMQ